MIDLNKLLGDTMIEVAAIMVSVWILLATLCFALSVMMRICGAVKRRLTDKNQHV